MYKNYNEMKTKLHRRAQFIQDKVELTNLNIRVETKKEPTIKEHIVVAIPNNGLNLYTLNTPVELKKIFSLIYRSDIKYVKSHIISLNNDVKYTKIIYNGRTYKIYTNLTPIRVLAMIDMFNKFDRSFINNHIISDKKNISKIIFNCEDIDTLDIY